MATLGERQRKSLERARMARKRGADEAEMQSDMPRLVRATTSQIA